MAVVGIGTDIVDIARVKNNIEQFGDKFAERILSSQELATSNFKNRPVQYVAKRFAAKEALMKALGTGLAEGLSFTDFSVLNDSKGKPFAVLTGKALEKSDSLGIKSWSISLSDEKHYAVAFVIAES